MAFTATAGNVLTNSLYASNPNINMSKVTMLLGSLTSSFLLPIVHTFFMRAVDSATAQFVYWSNAGSVNMNPSFTTPQFQGSLQSHVVLHELID